MQKRTKSQPQPLTERSMQHAERRIPAAAALAGYAAFKKALAETGKATIVVKGQIFRVAADGTETAVKPIAPPKRMKLGKFRREA